LPHVGCDCLTVLMRDQWKDILGDMKGCLKEEGIDVSNAALVAPHIFDIGRALKQTVCYSDQQMKLVKYFFQVFKK
jgi:hypothetical protein